MEKLLGAFSQKELYSFLTLLEHLKSKGRTIEEFLEYMREKKENEHKVAMEELKKMEETMSKLEQQRKENSLKRKKKIRRPNVDESNCYGCNKRIKREE
jgi:DNA-binding transcriptional MerR regulator